MVFAMWKNNHDLKTETKQVIMNGKKDLSHGREHINRIRESLIANMKTNKENENSPQKEEIEFLLKRL